MQMTGYSTGTYLNTRCAVSTFKRQAEPLLAVISDQAKQLLINASVFHFFSLPDLPQNVPLLYRLIRLYRPDKNAFLLGKYYLKMSVNEVALILGLPNSGEDFNFRRSPASKITQADIVEQLNTLANTEAVSYGDDMERVDALVKYVLIRFLFPLKSLRIPMCLKDFRGLDEFQRFNWPKAVHTFLHKQFESLYNLSCSRNEQSSLGYLEGCSIVLVVRD